MPRTGRGGSRQGTPGTAYNNRKDLNEPISVVPDQEYGQAGRQAQAQRAARMGASPVAAPQPNAAPQPAPGSLPTYEPTNRPHEPVTTGMDFGPGAGPEAMQPAELTLGQRLSSAIGDRTSASAIALATAARALGL